MMPKEISRKEAQRLIASGAQVLDVLELSEYRKYHLPGAVHIHLRRLAERAREKLDPDRPVVVYCHDYA
jgi:rhodanese-related sulfurtransferase